MKVKNNQGFTLVELLTTILILSILIVLAIVGVRTILENAKKGYYSSQNKTLVLAGQSYVQDNRNSLPKTLGRSIKIPLKKLKDQNYIKEVLDYSKKTCNLDKSYVKIYKYSKDKYSYMAYLDCPSYTSEEETYANGPTIGIDFKSAYDVAKADITISDPDKVISYSYIVYKDGNEIKNSGNTDAKQQKEVKKSISLKEYVPGKMKVAVIATDMYGNVSTKTVTEDIKDTIPPTCGSITGVSTTWTNANRKITITCSDTGSGCTRGDYTKTFKTSTKVGNIKIEDKAGNERSCPVNVYVDKNKPSCASSGGSATWTNGNRTLTGTCSDTGGSGCKGNVTKTFSSNTNTTTVSPGTVYDNAGNSTTCPANQTVRIDKTAPSCGSISGSSTTWTNANRIISVACNDNNSGCNSFNKTFTTEGTVDTIAIEDKAGNKNICNVNKYIDKTAPIISSISTYANSNTTYNLSVGGTDNLSGVRHLIVGPNTYWTSANVGSTNIGAGSTSSFYLQDAAGNNSAVANRTPVINNYNVNNHNWTVNIDEAIRQAKNGETIYLLRNYTDNTTAHIRKNITVNLQGNTLKRRDDLFALGGAQVRITGNNGGRIIITTPTAHTVSAREWGTTLTVDGPLLLTDREGGTLFGRDDSYSIVAVSNNATLNLNISNGAVESANKGVGNDGGTLNINMPGGTINSYGTGGVGGVSVWMKSGTITRIYNGTITGAYCSAGTVNNNSGQTMEIYNNTLINGFVANYGVLRMYNNTRVSQGDNVAFYNYSGARASMTDSVIIENNSTNRGTVSNWGEFWMNNGTIRNNKGGNAAWNQPGGIFKHQGGRIIGGKNF